MKKSFWLILVSAVLAGCNASEPMTSDTPNTPTAASFFASGPASTRTSFNEQTREVDWAVGDKVAVWAEKDGTTALDGVVFEATEADASGAKFEAFLTQMERGTYTYYSVYPAPTNISNGIATYELPAAQSGDYDCQSDILVAQPSTALALTQKGAALNLQYTHALHALRLDIPGGLDNYGNTIETVKITFPAAVAGSVSVDVKGESATTVEGSNVITVDCAKQMAAGTEAWAFIAPADLSEGKITIEATAAGNTTTFEVAGRNFRAGYASRVIVGMPEVLILEEVRTLLDNNSAGNITDPSAAHVAVRLGGANLSDVVRGGVEYNTSEGIKTFESTLPEGSQSFELCINQIPSGVYSMRGWVELPDGTIIYSDVAEGVRVVGNFNVYLGDVNTSYTYYQNSGAATANTKNGSSIYTSTNTYDMNSAFISEVSEVGISVDGVNYATTTSSLEFNLGEIGSQSWTAHNVEAYVTIGGVKFTSDAVNVEVTGIPYSLSGKGLTALPEGWTGDNLAWQGYGLGAGDSQKALRLKFENPTDQEDNGWIVSPAYNIPADLGVNVTVKTYLYRAWFTSIDGYIYAAPSSGSFSTDTSNGYKHSSVVLFYGEASFKDNSWGMTLTDATPQVTVYVNNVKNSDYVAWFTIDNFKVEYK